jgi:hypothetical protein
MRGRARVPDFVAGLVPPVPQEITLDTFTGTDGTNLTAHTMDSGDAWTAWAGSITIQSNRAVAQSGSNDYVTDIGTAQAKVVCKFQCAAANANQAASIILRGTDSTHYLIAYFSGDGNGVLYWRHSGSFDSLGTFVWAADASEHTATILCKGTTITVQIDSQTTMTFANITRQAGGTFFGLRGFVTGADKDSWDDFTIYTDRVVDAFPAPFPFNALTDNFTQADGTGLDTFGWTEDTGVWEVNTNKARQTGAASPANGYIVERDVGYSDVGLEVAVTTPAAAGFICGLAFRLQDKNNYLEFELNTNLGVSATGGGVGIWYTNNSGAYVLLAESYFVPANSTTYTLRVRAKGTLIIAEIVSPALRLECETTFLTGTKVGLFEARNASPLTNDNTYDDFKVYNS